MQIQDQLYENLLKHINELEAKLKVNEPERTQLSIEKDITQSGYK